MGLLGWMLEGCCFRDLGQAGTVGVWFFLCLWDVRLLVLQFDEVWVVENQSWDHHVLFVGASDSCHYLPHRGLLCVDMFVEV